jgi:hypothetical protein
MKIDEIEVTTFSDDPLSTRFISPTTFTRMTSLSRFKLRDLIKSGQIIARRCDARILVDLASVNRWIDSLPAEIFPDVAPPESSPAECMKAHNDYMASAKRDLFA